MPVMSLPAARSSLVLCVLAAAAGCGGGDSSGRHAVSGTVTVDGAPVQQGNINFQPVEQSTTSAGAVINNGTYSVPQEGGLLPGTYRVEIYAPVPGTGGTLEEGALPGEPLPEAEELIPPEWNTESEQTIEVKPEGPFEFNFDVKTTGAS